MTRELGKDVVAHVDRVSINLTAKSNS